MVLASGYRSSPAELLLELGEEENQAQAHVEKRVPRLAQNVAQAA
jgi:hypothetical protein